MDSILYTKEPGIARIAFNRPDKLNAFTEPMFAEIKSALADAEQDESVRVIIFSGEGRAFSAGLDLHGLKQDSFLEGGSFLEIGLDVSNRLAQSNKVSIAQVHGYCFTGALEFALWCDLIYCTEETKFSDTHAKFAMLPRWGMSQRLTRKVGLAKAKELTFRAMRIEGVEAERIGLVNRAFAATDLEAEVNRIAADILQNDSGAIGVIKEIYNLSEELSLAEGIAAELAKDPRTVSSDAQLAKLVEKNL